MGNREYDQENVNEILQSEIHYVDLACLRQSGIQTCVTGFLQLVQEEKLDGFWIHLDVDVMNDEIMPAVDSRDLDPSGEYAKEYVDKILETINSVRQ